VIEMSASSTLAASELHHGSPQTRPSLAAELLAEVREGLACREASVMPCMEDRLAAEVAGDREGSARRGRCGGREGSARRGGCDEFAAEVPLYAELHDLSSRHRDFVP